MTSTRPYNRDGLIRTLSGTIHAAGHDPDGYALGTLADVLHARTGRYDLAAMHGPILWSLIDAFPTRLTWRDASERVHRRYARTDAVLPIGQAAWRGQTVVFGTVDHGSGGPRPAVWVMPTPVLRHQQVHHYLPTYEQETALLTGLGADAAGHLEYRPDWCSRDWWQRAADEAIVTDD